MGTSGHYVLQEFIGACAAGATQAFVFRGAMETAASDFNLKTMDQVLAFIGNGGLENPKFVNTKDWENNPNPQQPIKVDAYHFSGGSVYGYVAFMKASAGKWNIKSFKKEPSGDPRNLPFAQLQGMLNPPKKES